MPESSAPYRFAAVVLAAGASSRMGAPKQLLLVDGQPLLLRAVRAALASEAWPVVVVLGAHAEKIRPLLARLPVLVADNPAWPEGMASSIRAGVALARQFSRRLDGVLVALCDQPAFSADTIARLVGARHASGASIVAARYGGRSGAPALFAAENFPALVALTGEEGARALLNPPAGNTSPIGAVDCPELALDLDTPGDYAALGEARGAAPQG
jgi:molybdenum cofactor cytidylyltransferase